MIFIQLKNVKMPLLLNKFLILLPDVGNLFVWRVASVGVCSKLDENCFPILGFQNILRLPDTKVKCILLYRWRLQSVALIPGAPEDTSQTILNCIYIFGFAFFSD